MEVNVDDYDFDFKIDFSEVLGALGNDTIKASNTSGLNSLLPGWLSDASLNLANVFAGNNFIDGGAGIDDIEAGAGDDFIDPGSRSGDKNEKVDGGAGNDTLRLYGKQADWEAAVDASSSHGAGWKKYVNKNAARIKIYKTTKQHSSGRVRQKQNKRKDICSHSKKTR